MVGMEEEMVFQVHAHLCPFPFFKHWRERGSQRGGRGGMRREQGDLASEFGRRDWERKEGRPLVAGLFTA